MIRVPEHNYHRELLTRSTVSAICILTTAQLTWHKHGSDYKDLTAVEIKPANGVHGQIHIFSKPGITMKESEMS